MKDNQKEDSKNKSNQAPGAGSDKQHPNTPSDANERFRKQKKEHLQDHPEQQNSG
jgi:hypothetical protein